MIKRVAVVLCLGLLTAWVGPPAQAQLDASLANFKEKGDLRKQINNGTVGIVAGGIDGTYIRIASDLSAVLDRATTCGSCRSSAKARCRTWPTPCT